jgi:hypothetical protein
MIVKTMLPTVDAVQLFVALPWLLVVAVAVPTHVTPEGGLVAKNRIATP